MKKSKPNHRFSIRDEAGVLLGQAQTLREAKSFAKLRSNHTGRDTLLSDSRTGRTTRVKYSGTGNWVELNEGSYSPLYSRKAIPSRI